MHNRRVKLDAIYAEHPELCKPGTIHNVTVGHDEFCELLKGTGECNCDPDILIEQDVNDEQAAAHISRYFGHARIFSSGKLRLVRGWLGLTRGTEFLAVKVTHELGTAHSSTTVRAGLRNKSDRKRTRRKLSSFVGSR